MARQVLSVSLPDELSEKLSMVCSQLERGKSWVIQKALTNFLEDQIDGFIAYRRANDGSKPIDAEKVFKDLGI